MCVLCVCVHVCVMCVCVVSVCVCVCVSLEQGARAPSSKEGRGSRARGHALLVAKRPNYVTILSLGELVMYM